jgi:hypothetical protein
MARSTKGFDKLLDDITKLEVNTIVKDNMTARKMPDPANAILDVAQTYGWYLVERKIPVKRWLGRDSPAHAAKPSAVLDALAAQQALGPWLAVPTAAGYGGFTSDDVRLDSETFTALRWAATTAIRHGGFSAPERVVLQRICRNCDHLKNLFSRLAGDRIFSGLQGKNRSELNGPVTMGYWERDLIALAPDDVNLLRKVWEIGVEEVVAQATIQLDGDVVNRISRSCATANMSHVLDVHRLGIQSAVGYWSKLMEAVAGFISDLAGLLTGPKG